MSSIKVGNGALSSNIVLIVVNQFPNDRNSECAGDSSAEAITRIVSRLGKGVGCKELKTMTYAFLQGGL